MDRPGSKRAVCQYGFPIEAGMGRGVSGLVCHQIGQSSLGIHLDGIYSGLRAEQVKLCALVIIGVNKRGEKYFLAIEVVPWVFWAAPQRRPTRKPVSTLLDA
uniref:hypothetical protein n=1 Tax=Candidatus Vondammii sp. HM_W22 TaxID=2687299 RepID=UPI001F13DD94|nr:hypothetical protein [Candidatus Vondammii sp. HM_W22]